MRKKYSYIAIILIVFLFSACQKKEEKFNSTTKTSNSTESTNSIPDEIKSLLALGKYDDTHRNKWGKRFLFYNKKEAKVSFSKVSDTIYII